MADNGNCKGRHGGICDCFKHNKETEKPPLGLRPRKLLNDQRKVEILSAMKRYSNYGKVIPLEWIEELRTIESLG